MTCENVGSWLAVSALVMLTACSADVLDLEGEGAGELAEAVDSAEHAIDGIDVPPQVINCSPSATIAVKFSGGVSESTSGLPYGTLTCPNYLVHVRTHWDSDYVTAAQAAAVDVGFVAEGTDRPTSHEIGKCIDYREVVTVSKKSFLASEFTKIGGGVRRGVLKTVVLPSGVLDLRCGGVEDSESFVPIPTVPGCVGPLCTVYRVSIRAYSAETGAKYPVIVQAARAEYLDLD